MLCPHCAPPEGGGGKSMEKGERSRGREGEEEAGGRVGGLRERKEEFNLKIAGRGPLSPYNKMNQH